VDYRGLSKVMFKNKYHLPRINGPLYNFHGAKVFSKIDLRSAYCQICVEKQNIPKTTNYGHYEFVILPFGLTNAPTSFMSLMNSYYLGKFVLVFLYDILIYSKYKEEHMEHLKAIFESLKTNKLFVEKRKNNFGAIQVYYLGHVVSDKGVVANFRKIKVVVEWPIFTDKIEMKSFLGLASYYRWFVKNFAQMALPLIDLLF
jgi:hypothetical protein